MSKPKSKQAEQHSPVEPATWPSTVKSIFGCICLTILVIFLIVYLLSPFLERVAKESTLMDLLGYIKSIGTVIAIWLSAWAVGYWGPSISFLPRK